MQKSTHDNAGGNGGAGNEGGICGGCAGDGGSDGDSGDIGGRGGAGGVGEGGRGEGEGMARVNSWPDVRLFVQNACQSLVPTGTSNEFETDRA
eukprot:3391459-Prymnesium_polylepis.1